MKITSYLINPRIGVKVFWEIRCGIKTQFYIFVFHIVNGSHFQNIRVRIKSFRKGMFKTIAQFQLNFSFYIRNRI